MWPRKQQPSFEAQNLIDRAQTASGLRDLEHNVQAHIAKENDIVRQLQQTPNSSKLFKHLLGRYKLNKRALDQARASQLNLETQDGDLHRNLLTHWTVGTMMTTNKSNKQLQKHLSTVDINKVQKQNTIAQNQLDRQMNSVNDAIEDRIMDEDDDMEADDLLIQQINDEHNIKLMDKFADVPRGSQTSSSHMTTGSIAKYTTNSFSPSTRSW
jgi:hypothetical protein